jgi:putative protein-disulfide isomerase
MSATGTAAGTAAGSAATLAFVHDPLCGWCYGASPLLRAALGAGAAEGPGEGAGEGTEGGRAPRLVLLHRALFTGANAHPHEGGFPEYAWANDVRIARVAGVPFSDAYRERVLGNPRLVHDSWNTALAKQVVDREAPGRGAAWFLAVEEARFSRGEDVTAPGTLARLAAEAAGIEPDAFLAAMALPETARAAEAERDRAADLCRRFGAGGVPLFVLERGGAARAVPHGPLLGRPEAFVRALGDAARP